MDLDLEFNTLALWNFLGFGNQGTKIAFTKGRFTVILGENLDDGGGDEGARNGAGKSSIIDAVFYALFGKTLRGVSGRGVIHKFGRKNQATTVELTFRKGDMLYLIERGENPSRLFFLGKPVTDTDDIRTRDGKGFKYDLTVLKRDTNKEIIARLGLNFLMSKYLWGNSTAVDAFLELDAADKRDIVEKLFGFGVLKERAEALKEERKAVSKKLMEKTSELTANEAANRRIYDQIQILENKSAEWLQYEASLKKQNEQRLHRLMEQRPDIKAITASYEEIRDGATELFKDNAFFLMGSFSFEDSTAHARAMELFAGIDGRISEYQFERGKHERAIQTANRNAQLAKDQQTKMLADSRKNKDRLKANIIELVETQAQWEKRLPVLEAELHHMENHSEVTKCPTCQQDWTDETKKEEQVQALKASIIEHRDRIRLSKERKANYEIELMEMAEPQIFQSETDTSLSQAKVAELNEKIEQEEAAKSEAEPVIEVLEEIARLIRELNTAQVELDKIDKQIVGVKAELDSRKDMVDPYPEQIENLKTSALVDLADLRHEVADLESDEVHYTFLIELLTKPDSFVRKKIIENWLLRLNHKISKYAREFGLSHEVRFDSEMEMSIIKRTKEYVLGNLSRGEQTRLSFVINFAFQDCFEGMYFKINVLFLDELLDNGLDPKGASQLIEAIKQRSRKHKHVFLITHRADISDHIEDTLIVRKQNDESEIIWT